jgi:hypothetical protein
MGKQSRRKREQKQHDHATDLRRAMREVGEEDRRAAVAELEQLAEEALGRSPHGVKAVIFVLAALTEGKPYRCLMCDSTDVPKASVWRPNEPCLRRHFGLPDGHIAAVLYPVCRRCADRSWDTETSGLLDIEARILASLRDQELIS